MTEPTPTPGDRSALRQRIARLPRSPGVYRWLGPGGEVLYVGKANDLRARVRSYLSGDIGEKNLAMVDSAVDVDFIAVRTQKEALLLEQTLIKRHKPRYNVRLTDGKQYPYIKLTGDRYPRLLKTHRYVDDGGTYFGPFPDGYGAFHVMQVLNEIFPLRRCKTLPTQKCLYYDIGKCIAPCIQACSDEEYDLLVGEVRDVLRGKSTHLLERIREDLERAATEHRFEDAARLRDQLQGLTGVLEKQHVLTHRLEDRDIAALAVRGDVAAVSILHQREGKIVGQSPFILTGAGTEGVGEVLADFLRGHYADRAIPRFVVADLDAEAGAALESDLRLLADAAVTVERPQRGDKRRWLEVAQKNADLRLEEEVLKRQRRGEGALDALQRLLGLPEPPRVMEGFDVSHQAGAHTRAAMVRFVDGEPDKKGYRTFGMKTVGEAAVAAGTADAARGRGREVDDFASIHEAVHRRYRGVLEREEPLPDLVVIDGGKGQLAAARAALGLLGLDAVRVVSLAKREEEIHDPRKMVPIRAPRSDPGLQLLQRVRDEAHRFGITQVRRKARLAVAAGPLDAVKGIGPKRRAELVKMFGGLEGLRAARVEDLMRVPGVTGEIAQAILVALGVEVEEPSN